MKVEGRTIWHAYNDRWYLLLPDPVEERLVPELEPDKLEAEPELAEHADPFLLGEEKPKLNKDSQNQHFILD